MKKITHLFYAASVICLSGSCKVEPDSIGNPLNKIIVDDKLLDESLKDTDSIIKQLTQIDLIKKLKVKTIETLDGGSTSIDYYNENGDLVFSPGSYFNTTYSYTYNEKGKLVESIQTIDEEMHQMIYGYENERLVKQIYYLDSVLVYEAECVYDDSSNSRSALVLGHGKDNIEYYNDRNLLIKKVKFNSDGITPLYFEEYTYNNKGWIKMITHYKNKNIDRYTITHTFNEDGQIIKEKYDGWDNAVYKNTYNDQGLLLKRVRTDNNHLESFLYSYTFY